MMLLADSDGFAVAWPTLCCDIQCCLDCPHILLCNTIGSLISVLPFPHTDLMRGIGRKYAYVEVHVWLATDICTHGTLHAKPGFSVFSGCYASPIKHLAQILKKLRNLYAWRHAIYHCAAACCCSFSDTIVRTRAAGAAVAAHIYRRLRYALQNYGV